MKRLMTILSAAVMLCSCSADEHPTLPQEKEQADSALVSFTIGIDPPQGATKSSITVSSQIVSDINLLAYHEGKLTEVLYVQGSQSISAHMDLPSKMWMFTIMMIWRAHLMNEQEIVSQMITFIEEKERQLQNSRLAADNQQRNNVVQSILDELERVTDQ